MSGHRGMRVTVDRQGEVHVDLIGYRGDACQTEEERLRDVLASLGLAVQVDGERAKSSAETAAEVRALSRPRPSDDARANPERKGRV